MYQELEKIWMRGSQNLGLADLSLPKLEDCKNILDALTGAVESEQERRRLDRNERRRQLRKK